MRVNAGRLIPLLVFLLLLVSPSGHANSPANDAEPASYIITTIYAPPFSIAPVQQGEKATGFIFDLVDMAESEIQLDLIAHFHPLARVLKKFRDGEGDITIASMDMVENSDEVITPNWACSAPIFYVPVFLYENLENLVKVNEQGFDHLVGQQVLISGSAIIPMRSRLPDGIEYKVITDANNLAGMFWHQRVGAVVSYDYIIDNIMAENPVNFEFSRRLVGRIPIELCINRRISQAESMIAEFDILWNKMYQQRHQEPIRSILSKYNAEDRWSLDAESR